MRRIISLLLVFLIITSSIPSFAAETGVEYYTIQVEYSDHRGYREELGVMIKDNNVYADAKTLVERLGYTYGENDEGIVFLNRDSTNDLPFGVTKFNLNSTKVERLMLYSMIDTYEAPFPAIKNSEGSWIPLEYSLLLMNSGMMISDDVLLIDIPKKKIIDYFYDLMGDSSKYTFNWEKDFGYTEKEVSLLGGSSHYVNLLSGLLDFDGASWVLLFQQYSGSYDAYNNKYGEELSKLFCTESYKELQETIDQVDLMVDALTDDGQLGSALSRISINHEIQIEELSKHCEAVLQKYKNGNSPLLSCNRSYQALEKALDKQTWFAHTALSFLKFSAMAAKVGGYAQEFQNQDEFSVDALTKYLVNESKGSDLLQTMKQSMAHYANALSGDMAKYTIRQFAMHIDEWISSGTDISSKLGAQANIALFAWNLASNIIPFIANGLEGAESFELALYSQVFQSDAFLNYQRKRDSIFADPGSITRKNVYDLSQYCFIYLKSCCITREAAIASLINKRKSVKERIQPLIDEQNEINAEIAEILVELKNADEANKGLVLGFLPADNREYLNEYDDVHLYTWIRTDHTADHTSQGTNDDGREQSYAQENEQQKKEDEGWKQAYTDYIDADSNLLASPEWCTCGLIYLDSDDIPELIIEYGSEAEGTKIVSFKKGKITEYQFSRTGGIRYIEREGAVYNSVGHAGTMEDQLALLDGNGFHDLGHGFRYDESQTYSNYTYFNWNGVEISEEEYYANIDGFDLTRSKQWNSYSEELRDNNYTPYEVRELLMNY